MQRRRSTANGRKRKSSVSINRPKAIAVCDKNVILERIIGSTMKSNNSVSINPRNNEIAYIAGNVIVIYDSETHKQLHFLKTGTGKTILSVQYSSDGKFLAVGEKGKNPSTFIWKVINHHRKPFVIAKLTMHRYGVRSISFSEGNSIVMTCGDHDGTVCLWNIAAYLSKKDDANLQDITSPVVTQRTKNEIYSCVYLKEHQLFLTVGHSHVKSWSIEKLIQADRRSTRLSDVHESKEVGIPVRAAVLGTFRNSNFVDVCSYEDRCFAIADDGHLYSLVMATANNRGRMIIEKAVNTKTNGACAISVNEKFISIAFGDGILRLIDRTTLEYLGALPKPKALGNEATIHSSFDTTSTDALYPDVMLCHLSNDNNLFSAYSDGSFISWNLNAFPSVRKNFCEYAHNQCIWDMQLLEFPSHTETPLPSRTLVTCSADNTIRFWDHPSICDASFDSKSALRGIIHTDESYKCLQKSTPSSTSGIRCFAVSPDYQHIASGDRQGNIRIHKLSSLQLMDYKEAHDAEVLSLAYAPRHQSLLASASRDRLIHLFDTSKNYSHVDTLDDHSSSITSVHFASVPSPKGPKLNFISCSADKSILFRSMDKETEKSKIERYANAVLTGTVYDMCYDKETQSVVATGKDKKLTRFDIRTGKQQGDTVSAVRESEEIINLTLHYSGEFALASSTDKCLRMYACGADSNTSGNKENLNRRVSTASTASRCLLVANGASFITSSCFSPCSSRIFGASADGMIFIWRVSPTLVQKLSRNLQSPALVSPRLGLSLRKRNVQKIPKPEQLGEEEQAETLKPSSWISAEEIESSLVHEYGLVSQQKPDTFGFKSVFSNDEDAKVQALRRLTIEPSSQNEPTVNDSMALASALSDMSAEDNFFDFGNFTEIPESAASSARLSLSRVFRQASSPRQTPPKKKFLTPDHSPIQVTTPLHAAPIEGTRVSTATHFLNTPVSLIALPSSTEESLTPVNTPVHSPEPMDNDNNAVSVPTCEKVKQEIEEDNVANALKAPQVGETETLSNDCAPCADCVATSEQEENTEPECDEKETNNVFRELSSLLGAHNQQIAETKQILEDTTLSDDDEQDSMNNEDVNEETETGEVHSYDLQVRHQVAMNLLQNAFENAMQLYEDANFEYECIQKEETQSPYAPVYEQILDNYETVFHSLSQKLSGTPQPPPVSQQLEQYSSMLLHLSSLIKDKKIVP